MRWITTVEDSTTTIAGLDGGGTQLGFIRIAVEPERRRLIVTFSNDRSLQIVMEDDQVVEAPEEFDDLTAVWLAAAELDSAAQPAGQSSYALEFDEGGDGWDDGGGDGDGWDDGGGDGDGWDDGGGDGDGWDDGG
ncbi:MAG: hypothetical protein HYY06_32850, partial [Deltaproteobacteria bacterium]|nr:hypothetical protein [Deltaproteobacteria bacterium]